MKLSFILPLFLFASCSHSDHWAFNRIDSGEKEFNSTKLTFYSPDPINGIDLEFTRISDNLRTYLNVHSLPIPPSKEHPKSSKVHLVIGNQTFEFLACRHEGGQRLLVPEEMAEQIILGLKEHGSIQIKVPGYFVTIDGKDFEKKFEQLGYTPLFRNPFHLPF